HRVVVDDDEVLDLDGQGRDATLLVLETDAHEERPPGKDPRRRLPRDDEVLERLLAEDAGRDDHRAHPAEEEEQEVVPRVHRGEADADGDDDEVLALAAHLEAPPPAEQAPEEPHHITRGWARARGRRGARARPRRARGRANPAATRGRRGGPARAGPAP